MKTWIKVTLSAAFLVSGCFSAPSPSAPSSSLSVAPKAAEQDELVTDRPDFTESSEVTRRDWTQVESGVAMEMTQQSHERRLSLGNLLIRMGLTKRLELRLGSEGLIHDASYSPGSARLFGRSDMDAGLKYKFIDEGRIRPAISVIASLLTHRGSRLHEWRV